MGENTDASLLAKLQETQTALVTANSAIVWNPDVPKELQKVLSDLFTGISNLLAESAAALRRSGEALRRLQESLDWEKARRHDELQTLLLMVRERGELKAEIETLRQSGAEGTEAGGCSQPLAPTIEDL